MTSANPMQTLNVMEIIELLAPRPYKVSPNSERSHYSMACCLPGHETDREHFDHSGSFMVNAAGTLFYCFGCGGKGNAWQLRKILSGEASVNSSGRPEPKKQANPKSTKPKWLAPRTGVALDELARAKGLDSKFLREKLGWRDITYFNLPAVRIPYFDENGKDPQMHIRVSLKGDDGNGQRFFWQRNSKIRPLGLERLSELSDDVILLVEGDTDYATLTQVNLPSLGIPGANTFKPEWAEYVRRFKSIVIWQEPGKGGQTFVDTIVKHTGHERVKIIAPPGGVKDPTEFHHLSGYVKFRATMLALIENATPALEPEPDIATQSGIKTTPFDPLEQFRPSEPFDLDALEEPPDFPNADTVFQENSNPLLQNMTQMQRLQISRRHWYDLSSDKAPDNPRGTPGNGPESLGGPENPEDTPQNNLGTRKSLISYLSNLWYEVSDLPTPHWIRYAKGHSLKRGHVIKILEEANLKWSSDAALHRLQRLRVSCCCRQAWICTDPAHAHGTKRSRITCRTLFCQDCPTQAAQNVGAAYLADLVGAETRTTYVIMVQLPANGDVSMIMEELGKLWPHEWRKFGQRKAMRGKVMHRAEKWMLDRTSEHASVGSRVFFSVMVSEAYYGECAEEIKKLALAVGGDVWGAASTQHGLTAVAQLMEDASCNLIECAADTIEEERDMFLAWYMTLRRRTTFQPAGPLLQAYMEAREVLAEERKMFDPGDVRCEVITSDGMPCGLVCTHYWYPEEGDQAGEMLELYHDKKKDVFRRRARKIAA